MSELEPGLAAAVGSASTAIIGGAALWLANRLIGKAAVQTAINQGFKEYMDRIERDRDMLLSKLDTERVKHKAEVGQMQGEINGLRQLVESLQNLMRRSGLEIPTHESLSKQTALDFELYQEPKK